MQSFNKKTMSDQLVIFPFKSFFARYISYSCDFIGLNIFISILSVQQVLCEQYKVKRIGTEAKC